jgi:amino acid transporter
MPKKVSFFILLALVAFALHFVWEWAHLPLYQGYEALGSGLPLVAYATLGDVMYTLFAVLLVALFKRRLLWPREARAGDYAGLAILGLLIALFVEYKGLYLHRWAYTAAMPLALGVGLSPLLQMTILLPLSVGLTALLARQLRIY